MPIDLSDSSYWARFCVAANDESRRSHGRISDTTVPSVNLPGGPLSFFREVTKDNAMPPQDPELWRAYGMELLGPPLPVE